MNTRVAQVSPEAVHWQPSADLQRLRARAELLASLRAFFRERDVLEVETPLLCSTGVTDPSIEPLVVERGRSIADPRYLQTSPEYVMKRLLAAGSGPIYQLARAFRDGEVGPRHNPEFSLLEWYRPGYDLSQLMTEVEELLLHCLGVMPCERRTYRQWFQDLLEIDPMVASQTELEDCARRHLDVGSLVGGRDLWLDLLVSHVLEPHLAQRGICFVHDYPGSQAALARVEYSDGVPVARRFEVYVNGLELANGYLELTDPHEQRRRFMADNAHRRESGLAERPVDELLLAAMEAGMPNCSGVALGIDRLLMQQLGINEVQRVMAFDWLSC